MATLMDDGNTVQVSIQRYTELVNAADLLDSLRCVGVEGWAEYNYAVEVSEGRSVEQVREQLRDGAG